MANDGFTLYFIASSTVSSVIMMLILLTKKSLRKHISSSWQYNIDLLFLVLLAIPFLPPGLIRFISAKTSGFNELFIVKGPIAYFGQASTGAIQVSGDTNWLQDFSLSVDRTSAGLISPIFMIIWLSGVIAFIIFAWRCNRELRLITESLKPIGDELIELFRQCKAELGIKQKIVFGTSVLARSPMTVGLFNTYVILPEGIEKISPIQDIRYILIHELVHCKKRHIPINNLMCLFQILYWFNPVVFIALREMRLDRELYCDRAVLNHLSEEHHVAYGKTLLHFADKLPGLAAVSFATDLGSSKRQIKKRIEEIVSFVKESKLLKFKSISIFVIIGLLVFFQIPAASTLALSGNDIYNFHGDNATYEDLSGYFEEFDGSFVMYDMESDLYTIHNKEGSTMRVSPASTYKIYSALIAMDTGIIDSNNSSRIWDGTDYPFEAWNKNHDLSSAMKNSVSWYFQELDAQVGKNKLASYFDRLSYGNKDLSGNISEYWIESSLRISPIEQVALLADFCRNETIFTKKDVDTLKEILKLEEKGGAVVSGKTGTSSVNGKTISGWFIGYVEKNGNTTVFATRIQGEDNANGSNAAKITLDILHAKGIY